MTADDTLPSPTPRPRSAHWQSSERSSRKRWLVGGAAVVAAAALFLTAGAACSSTPGIETGARAPNITLTDDRGRAVELRERLAAGKIVVLSFYPQDDTPG